MFFSALTSVGALFLMHKTFFKGDVNMDLNLLELMHEGYTYGCEINKNIEEVKEFDEKYIKPLLKQNPKAGMDMEEMFNSALAEYEIRAFKNGFRACIQFIMDCLKDD